MKKLAWLSTSMLMIALLVSSCASGANAPAASNTEDPPFRVAFVAPSAINDLAFSQSMYDALMRIQLEMGMDDFQFAYSENMYVVDDAEKAIRNYASQGYNLVIAHGTQYGSFLQEIAPEFPKTSFAWGTTVDTFGLPNVFSYEAAAEEGGYVNGVLAATLSRSKVIGVVGPIEVGDAKLYIDGFKVGVAATNPTVHVQVTYTGSFSDANLATTAAAAHILASADVLTGTAQMVTGPVELAAERHVLWFGTQSNQTSLAPSIVVASQVY
ncbi:MAG TPA: BMP family protein, partial [Anaerolineales bacterium]|nr:BMP family protein [Anaerolineales bacterium]